MKNFFVVVCLCALSACAINQSASELRASRAFAGPTQFPPSDFAGYGILVFPADPARSQKRFEMFCLQYLASITSKQDLLHGSIPESEQMVTVMPVTSNEIADRLNMDETDDACEIALQNYDLVQAQHAIRKAEAAGNLTDGLQSLSGRGPFLLAWSPGQAFGSEDALVLAADLSNTSTPEQAASDMRTWRRDIEQNPNHWRRGWSLESIRLVAQRWVDRRGDVIIKLIGDWG